MFNHETVLLHETVDMLEVKPSGIYVDATLGGGGHSEYLLSQLNEEGHLFAFDQDMHAIHYAQKKLSPHRKKVTFIKSNFRWMKEELAEMGVTQVSGIFYDLGVSSPQLDQSARGFSYQKDAELDMRMDQEQDLTAKKIINGYHYKDLVRIFFQYGEEKFAKQIARKIETYRQKKTIQTTGQLVEIIKDAIPAPARRQGGHPAKRTFQALRIAVNDELESMKESLGKGLALLEAKGRMSVITFHSLEDRITKQLFKEKTTPKETPRHLPIIPSSHQTDFELITKKPVLPSAVELEKNNRARSAKLRVIAKK